MRGHGSLYSINPWLLYKYIIVCLSCLIELIYGTVREMRLSILQVLLSIKMECGKAG